MNPFEYLRDRQEVDGDPADFLEHVFVQERQERHEVHVEQRDVARRDDSRQVDCRVKETDDHQRERRHPLAPRIAARLLRRRTCNRVGSNCFDCWEGTFFASQRLTDSDKINARGSRSKYATEDEAVHDCDDGCWEKVALDAQCEPEEGRQNRRRDSCAHLAVSNWILKENSYTVHVRCIYNKLRVQSKYVG